MSWSRNAILVVLLIAVLLNVVAGVSVPSTRAILKQSYVTIVKNEAVSALNSAPVAPFPSIAGASQAIINLLPMTDAEAPSGKEIVPKLKAHFQEPSKNPADARRIMFVDAPRDRSRPGLDKPQPEVKGKGKARVMPNLAINLENPQASGVPANWVLVANYHTHP
ncbi:hypothetical protein BC829DRAFT_420743 [Chytridium lagenaria]|nr:hypothetical protein BC829DRAFT_420743 [Chytridium lagenaria]